ncbi:hypothetical protein C3L33_13276, partial [Rhododendron williamsianum]
FPNAYLLVGCCNDEVTHKYKGKTVMNESERYESLRHCKWVDEVIPDAPWVINQEFLDKYNIDYVAHDSLPYADTSGAGKDVYEFVKAVGKFKETKRTDGISTSDIIMRIVKDYNQYVMRNLDRGYTRKELGVSYVKEKRLRVNMRLKKLQEKVKEQQEKVFLVFGKNLARSDMVWKDIRAVYMNLRGTVLSLGELAEGHCVVVAQHRATPTAYAVGISTRAADEVSCSHEVTRGKWDKSILENLHLLEIPSMHICTLQIQTVAKTAEMHRNEWVENADRWVAGFLEMFEEGCHKMGTAIRDRIQERLMGQQAGGLLQNGNEEDEYYDDDSDDYYEEEYYEEEKS